MSHPATPVPRALVALLTVLGAGAITVALLGPLGLDWLRYHVSPGATDQVRGGDLAGLLMVGPAALTAAVLLHRGRTELGLALGAAPAAYGVYTYAQLTMGGEPFRYPGTSERFFPLLAGLVAVAGAALVLCVGALARSRPPEPARLDRVTGWYLLGAGTFLALGLHLPGLVDAWRATPTSEEYAADPGLFWIVKLMDLAIVLPILVALGVGLLRSRDWARLAMAPALGWCALLASSVAGMAVSMWVTGAPGASLPLALGFLVVAAGAVALALAGYRRLAVDSRPSTGSRDRDARPGRRRGQPPAKTSGSGTSSNAGSPSR